MLQNILIIEDDADIAESLHYNFKREGFRSTIAESAEKGRRLYRQAVFGKGSDRTCSRRSAPGRKGDGAEI